MGCYKLFLILNKSKTTNLAHFDVFALPIDIISVRVSFFKKLNNERFCI